jgi:tetratricopeptide (TPR) repeat protein
LKKIIFAGCWLFVTVFCYAQENLSRGEALLMQNNPREAVIYLENAVSDDASNTKAYLYLGIVYEQLGSPNEAVAVYRRILPVAGSLSANVANNLGNVYFQTGNNEMAEQYYSQAIDFNSGYSKAYLGRANTRIKAGNLRSAVSDYEQYLTLEPASSQKAKIEQLVSLLKSEFAAEERRKIIAEEEARRAAEERQKLLDSVSASLHSAADLSKSLSSGAENVEQYDGEFVLD